MKVLGSCVVEILEADAGEARRHVLGAGSYTLGSSDSCDLPLKAVGVSRRHLQIDVLPDGGAVAEDLGSRNGTLFAKRRISRRAVTESTRLTLGDATVTIHPDCEAAHVVGLPSMAPTGNAARSSAAPSLATELSNSGWRLVQSIDELVAAEQDSVHTERMLPDLMIRWQELSRARYLRLSRTTDREAILLSLGELAEDNSEPIHEAVAGDLRLQIVAESAHRPITMQVLAALRIGLAVLATRLTPQTKTSEVAGQRDDAAPSGSSVTSQPTAVFASSAMRDVYALATKVARGSVSTLIRGESGVGKELLARWIHQQSPRSDGPFLAINCAALPAELLEAELFGIERGIATGVDAREGLLERARGGSLFLDELGDMATSTQAKILRALESDSVYRVGGTRPYSLDVRFIAATHQSIEQRIADGAFRLDLFHRIAAVELLLPPLRERREDIALLATRFLAEELSRLGRASPGMTEAALAALCQHDWPGNVRELRNEMARAALLLSAHQPLERSHLSPRIADADDLQTDLSLDAALSHAEREAFAVALAIADDEHAAAMALLKLPRSSYFRRLRQLRGEGDTAATSDATEDAIDNSE